MGGSSPTVEDALARASAATGIPVDTLRTYTRIEFGGDPRNRTGKQPSRPASAFARRVRKARRREHLRPVRQRDGRGARKLAANFAQFERSTGVNPTAAELYLQHQQGVAGAAGTLGQPRSACVESMLSTGEGRQKGEGWARQAIWERS